MKLRVLDGGMSKLLITRGLPMETDCGVETNLWSARSIMDSRYHEMVIDAHYEYLLSGVDVITTNNYAITPRYLKPIKCDHMISDWTKTSVLLARKAIQKFNRNWDNTYEKRIFIAGSIPPLMKSHRHDLILEEKISKKYYKEIIGALNEENVDIFLAETMSCIDEVIWILEVLNDINVSNTKEIWISFSLNDENGNLRSNEKMNDAIIKIGEYKMKYSLNITIVSMNCCLVECIDNGLENICVNLLKKYNLMIGIYPNCMENIKHNYNANDGGWRWALIRNEITPQIYYQKYVMKWLCNKKYKDFIKVIGGCCGVEPKHISYVSKHIQNIVDKVSVQSKM